MTTSTGRAVRDRRLQGDEVDVLSGVLSAVRRGQPFANRESREGTWRIAFGATPGIGFHLVLTGSCVLSPGSNTPPFKPVVLHAGDVVLIPRGSAHVLTNAGVGQADSADLLCGVYELDRLGLHPLLEDLPHTITLSGAQDRHRAINGVVELLTGELSIADLGNKAALSAMLDLMLLFLLRDWLTTQADSTASRWSAALGDSVVGTALRLIHNQPARPWSVEELGAQTGLSRAAFSRRFTSLVGQPPMAYLTYWRMTIAAKLLRETELPLSAIALRCGYGSSFAFAAAFKREHKEAPGHFRSRKSADARA